MEPENEDVEYKLIVMINQKSGLTAGHYTADCYDLIKEREKRHLGRRKHQQKQKCLQSFL